MKTSLLISWWFAIGALAGVGHAASLWRSARRPGRSAWGGLARFLLVGATLLVSTAAGSLLPAAMGWGCGLAVACALIYARAST